MDFADLMRARPAGYDAAAQALRAFGEDVRDRAVDYWNQVAQPLKDTSSSGLWGGAAADAAQVPMMDLQLALNRAADQIEAVPQILTQYAADLEGFQRRLEGIVAEARATGAEVNDTGQVTVSDQVQQNNPDRPKLAEEIAADIGRVLEQATQRDVDCSVELRETLADETLDAHDVGTQYRDAIKDANRAARLLDSLGDAQGVATTADARAELVALLNEHADDPEFATRLFKTLDGRGMVEALADLTRLGNAADELAESGMAPDLPGQLTTIQSRLGEMLGTATDPDPSHHLDVSDDSPWLNEFTKAGRATFDLGLPGFEPYGYQLIGNVLHSGNYSSEFLNTIAPDMLEMDKAGAFEENIPNSSPIWDGFTLNHVDDVGAGFDPMNGLMMAMERNPEAATDFFSEDLGEDPNETTRIEYLLSRENWHDVPNGAELHGDDPSQSLVIDAIDAATRGVEPETKAFDVFEHTVQHIGSPAADVGGLHNNLARESMGRLLEGQIGQVHDAFGGADNFNLAPETDRALNRVLGDIGHSPEAYASLSNAERAYAVTEMRDVPAQNGGDILVHEAEKLGRFMGHLDHGRIEALEQEWRGREDEYNDRLGAVGLLGEVAVDTTLGHVPAAGTAVKGLLGDIVESAKVDYTDEEIAERTNLYENSRANLKTLAKNYIWENELHGQPVPDELIRDGKPIPLDDMTDQQRRILNDEWLAKNTEYSTMVGEVNDAYSTAFIEARQGQSGGY